ncbi:MAG: VOC family protein [Clostridia bacterium]|nr:VOC family protein [Clostridia bacterium]MDD4387103.1 VOC family protein [Clostridia bacterium]
MKFNKLIPELTVSDIDKSKEFYIEVLGFELEYERLENKFAFISLKECQIMLQEKTDSDKWDKSLLEYPFGRGINFQIDVENIDDIYSSIINKQYKIEVDIEFNEYRENDKIWKEKEFLIRDPDGYLLRFAQTLNY